MIDQDDRAEKKEAATRKAGRRLVPHQLAQPLAALNGQVLGDEGEVACILALLTGKWLRPISRWTVDRCRPSSLAMTAIGTFAANKRKIVRRSSRSSWR
jgi:hypothetical protein